jgi:hypothetical protein
LEGFENQNTLIRPVGRCKRGKQSSTEDCMIRLSCLFSACVLASVSAGFASPTIAVDKTTFDCGVIVEGKTDKLHAQFTVKNTGDAPLKIDNVRPGCGCTVVKFDTLVLPGKSSVIQSTVNIANFHSGALSKSITVQSNASNSPSMQLTITASIKPIIEVSEQYVTLTSQKPHTIVLASAKKDLHISEVILKTTSSGASSTPSWQTTVPLQIAFKVASTDSTRPDGLLVFKLDLTAPAVTERMSGQFVIKTNHPDKPEILLNGSIER